MRAPAIVATVLFLSAGTASAQKPSPDSKKAGAAQLKQVDLKPAIAKIQSNDEAQIQSGLAAVRILRAAGATAAPAIADALRKGLTLGLTKAALETMGDTEAETGSAVEAVYASHRNLGIRRTAVKALARTMGPIASTTLQKALSDEDPVVRGSAASGLGSVQAKDAVPDLFVALEHRVYEAAASIGQLCNADDCDKLTAQLGKLPFDVVTGGLDHILFRQPTDVSDDAKVNIIGKLRDLGTLEANKFLSDVQKRWPAEWTGRVKPALDQAVLATSGGVK